MHSYADGGVSEEFEDDDFDPVAEAARIQAEADARAAGGEPPEGQAGGAFMGHAFPADDTPAATADDWEPLE